MSTKHPITPPPELVQQWIEATRSHDCIGAYPGDLDQQLATQAARWGADQELEACINEIYRGVRLRHIDSSSDRELLCSDLRAARRPKPPSLKEQALAVISNSVICDHLTPEHEAILRRALEQLDD